MVLEEPSDALLEFPSEVFPSAAMTIGLVPVSSSYALLAPPPVGLRCPAPWSLGHSGVGWSFPTADPSGFRDLRKQVADP
jgi:hypothetical protein